jgi:hypothetical protein
MFENDPHIFFDQYGNLKLVYLDFHGDQMSMGDPDLLGQFYFGGGSKSDVLGLELGEAVRVGIHEIEHGNYAHSEETHRLMESNHGFSDYRNYSKLSKLFNGEIGYN